MKLDLKYKVGYEETYNGVFQIKINNGELSFMMINNIFTIKIPMEDLESIQYGMEI